MEEKTVLFQAVVPIGERRSMVNAWFKILPTLKISGPFHASQPPFRLGISSTFVDSSLYTIGGRVPNHFVLSNCISCLCTVDDFSPWRTRELPSPCADPVIGVYGDSLYILPGVWKYGYYYMDENTYLTTRKGYIWNTREFKCLETRIDPPEVEGEKRQWRRIRACAALDGEGLLIAMDGKAKNFFLYNPEKNEWDPRNFECSLPKFIGETSFAASNGRLYILEVRGKSTAFLYMYDFKKEKPEREQERILEFDDDLWSMDKLDRAVRLVPVADDELCFLWLGPVSYEDENGWPPVRTLHYLKFKVSIFSDPWVEVVDKKVFRTNITDLLDCLPCSDPNLFGAEVCQPSTLSASGVTTVARENTILFQAVVISDKRKSNAWFKIQPTHEICGPFHGRQPYRLGISSTFVRFSLYTIGGNVPSSRLRKSGYISWLDTRSPFNGWEVGELPSPCVDPVICVYGDSLYILTEPEGYIWNTVDDELLKTRIRPPIVEGGERKWRRIRACAALEGQGLLIAMDGENNTNFYLHPEPENEARDWERFGTPLPRFTNEISSFAASNGRLYILEVPSSSPASLSIYDTKMRKIVKNHNINLPISDALCKLDEKDRVVRLVPVADDMLCFLWLGPFENKNGRPVKTLYYRKLKVSFNPNETFEIVDDKSFPTNITELLDCLPCGPEQFKAEVEGKSRPLDASKKQCEDNASAEEKRTSLISGKLFQDQPVDIASREKEERKRKSVAFQKQQEEIVPEVLIGPRLISGKPFQDQMKGIASPKEKGRTELVDPLPPEKFETGNKFYTMEVMSMSGGAFLSSSFERLLQELAHCSFYSLSLHEEVHTALQEWKSLFPRICAVLNDAEEKQMSNRSVKTWLDDLKDLAYDMEDILDRFKVDVQISTMTKRPNQASTMIERPYKASTIKFTLKFFSCFRHNNNFVDSDRPNQASTMIERPYQASTIKFTLKFFSCFRHNNNFVDSNRPNQASTIKFTLKSFSCFRHNNNFVDSDTVSKLKVIALRLQDMAVRSGVLGLLSLKIQHRQRPEIATARRMLPTASLPESHVYGREREKAAILQKLLIDDGSSEHGGFCVLPIVGIAGIGKTTLARLVFNEVGPENFQLKAWVCVSEVFDVVRITRNILEALTEGMPDLNDLNLLQEKLKEKLFDKKFLLVLDDVWNEDYALWDVLQRPFFSGAPGSKIIITTRSMRVAKIMGGKDVFYHLEALKDDECLSMLAEFALGEKNFDDHPSLKQVGEKIVKMCEGLPLTVKIYGGLLCGKLDLDEWKYVLNIEPWNLPNGKSILPALSLGYHYLPSHLKQCFAYLAVFPKDCQFSKEEVIFLWMAEGLLQPQLGKNQMEDIGGQYLHDLHSRSMIQSSSEDLSQFVMHDLMHDLAEQIAGETCCNLEHLLEAGRSEVNSEKVRYLSFHRQEFDISEKFEVLNKMKSLRTFVHIDSSSHVCYLSNTVHDWLVELRCLRVLSFQYYQMRKLPDSIGNLKCLRYLNLSESRIDNLPESIGFLLSLQTLMLRGCRMFSKFPATIGNLIDLHHLDITNTPSLKAMPQEIANLKNLLTLPKFIVGKSNGLRLSDVMNLFHLRGHLSILELQNVCDIQDARRVNLHRIEGLDELVLQWTSNFDNFRDGSNIEMKVLDFLKPHSNLKRFTIRFYGGERFPSWIGDPSFCKLSYLKLTGCRRSTSLPSLGQLSVLQELIIEGMDAIEVVDFEFYHGTFISLQTLKFHNMSNWEKWAFQTATGVEFPRLVDLEITNCPKLAGKLPSHISSLVNLVISGCRKLTCSFLSLPSLQKLCIVDCEQVLLKSMVYLTSLTVLQLEDISGLCCLPKSFTESLAALETLRIEQCSELKCLLKEGVDILKLARLRSVMITGCPELVSLTSQEQGLLPSNLKYLELSNCKNLKSLPDGIMVKTDGSNRSNMLERLIIRDCPNLESFPRGKLPTKLNRLEIVGCTNAESLLEGTFDNNSNIEDLLITRLPSLKYFHDDQLPAALKHLEISDCYSLESISEMVLQHCTGLKWMEIRDCVNLKSLSFNCLPSLTRLCIERCDALESFLEMPELRIPNIQYLKIEYCQNLKVLPNNMCNLTLLKELHVGRCPGIESIPEGGLPSNLTVLSIDCENLKQHMQDWGLHTLTSLDSFRIGFVCPPEYVLPSSLTTLWIKGVPNLESIPSGLLQNLNSLKELGILRCPNLRFLPREGLPPFLGQLRISGCPLLNPETFQEKGDNWRFISHIPFVRINGIQITPL